MSKVMYHCVVCDEAYRFAEDAAKCALGDKYAYATECVCGCMKRWHAKTFNQAVVGPTYTYCMSPDCKCRKYEPC